MEIAILGFGAVARELVRQLKELPIYGESVRVYCIHTRRNSMSYGPNLVVEIVDKYGDGLRVYNDGYQATDLRTTVSSFEDWLVDQSRGTFDVVVDCTSYNDDSVRLVKRLLSECSTNNFKFFLPSKELVQKHWLELTSLAKRRGIALSFNSIVAGDRSQYSDIDLNQDTLAEYIDKEDQDLFIYRNGGPTETARSIVDEIKRTIQEKYSQEIDWDSVVRGPEWKAEAAILAAKAAEDMENRLIERRIEAGERLDDFDEDGVAFPGNFLDQADLDILNRFVINGEGGYVKSSKYDNSRGRLIVSHEMLDWFFGKHLALDTAANTLKKPNLRLTAAKYIKYDTPGSHIERHISSSSCNKLMIMPLRIDGEWTVYLGGREHRFSYPSGILLESDRVTLEAIPLEDSGISVAEILEFHFSDDQNSGPCECFK